VYARRSYFHSGPRSYTARPLTPDPPPVNHTQAKCVRAELVELGEASAEQSVLDLSDPEFLAQPPWILRSALACVDYVMARECVHLCAHCMCACMYMCLCILGCIFNVLGGPHCAQPTNTASHPSPRLHHTTGTEHLKSTPAQLIEYPCCSSCWTRLWTDAQGAFRPTIAGDRAWWRARAFPQGPQEVCKHVCDCRGPTVHLVAGILLMAMLPHNLSASPEMRSARAA
jgi:hypothetical protein